MAISPRTMCASLSPRKVSRARRCAATLLTSQTWLAQPRTLLASVCSASESSGKRLAELDHVAVAVLPVVQEGEILDELVDGMFGAFMRATLAQVVGRRPHRSRRPSGRPDFRK